LKGNKNLHNIHPSNPKPIKNNKNTVGYYLVDNWTNIVSRRYINYVETYGVELCVDTTKLSKQPENKTENQPENKTDNHTENKTENQIEIKKQMNESKKFSPEKFLSVLINNTDSDKNSEKYSQKDNEIKIDNCMLNLTFDYKYFKYQEEIINLKRLVFYMMNNKGIIKNDIFTQFSEEVIKSVFGDNYILFLTPEIS
jgi:hypothetical protein